MKFKLVPDPPDELEFVGEVQRAIPLVPGSEDDCCARIMSRTTVSPRDEARTWMTFLRALGLVVERDRGFTRTRREPDREVLRESFRANVYGVDEVLEILTEADGTLAADQVFERYEGVPNWERHKNPDSWEAIWRDRIENELEWGVLFGLIERTGDGYDAT